MRWRGDWEGDGGCGGDDGDVTVWAWRWTSGSLVVRVMERKGLDLDVDVGVDVDVDVGLKMRRRKRGIVSNVSVFSSPINCLISCFSCHEGDLCPLERSPGRYGTGMLQRSWSKQNPR